MSYNRENVGRLHIYTNNNITNTIIAVANVLYPILFTTTPALYNNNFTVATNSFTYNGQSNQFNIKISGNMNKVGGVNTQVGICIYKNGVQITGTETNFFVDDAEQYIYTTQVLTTLNPADVLVVYIKNVTNTNNLIVNTFNMIIE